MEIVTGPSNKFLFTYRVENSVAPGTVAFGALQVRFGFLYIIFSNVLSVSFYFKRKWAMIGIDQKITVTPYMFDLKNESINIIILQVDFLSKKL